MFCTWCDIDMGDVHGNKKYCSTTCENKARYDRAGQRSTPEQRRQWYENRCLTDGYKEKLRNQGNKRYEIVQAFLRSYKILHGCMDCGFNSHHAALEFDHVSGEKKLNVCLSKSISQAKKEIEKCQVVCSNCHKIRTFDRLQKYPCKPDIFKASYEEVDNNAI